MSDEIEKDAPEVEVVKKKAYLVVGVIPKDTRAVAQHIQVNLEYETHGRIDRISEQDLICEYVEGKGYHPLCKREWLEPIKNKIIISLLEKTESVIKNEHVQGVIVDGSFALDVDVRQAYTEILEDQGYEVVVVPVQSDMVSIFFYGWSSGTSLKSLYTLWKKYNHQFTRTYVPMEDQPTAIVVDENVTDPIFIEIIQSLSKKNKIIVLSKELRFGVEHPFDVHYVMVGPNKIDVFWTKIANHFKVKLVIDNDPNAVHRWHQIDVPVISLTSQFALERNL
jgi:hypothetical protein